MVRMKARERRSFLSIGFLSFTALVSFSSLAATPAPTVPPTIAATPSPKASAPSAIAPAPDPDAPVDLGSNPHWRDWIYFGADFGFSMVSTQATFNDNNKNGFQFNAKVIGTRYWRKWLGDIGIGWFYNRQTGDNAFSTPPGGKVTVTTWAGMFELSPRYRFNEHWQLGPVVNGLFGTDVSFDENTNDSGENLAVLVGPRIQYETSGEESRWRYGAQILTDLTIADRQAWLIQLDIQFGIPLKKIPAQPAPTPAPAVVASVRPKMPQFAEVTPEKKVKIYLGEAVLRFQTAKSALRPSSKEILTKVSSYLKKAPAAWGSMRIEGHADRRGKVAYNEKLSLARAEAVKATLVKLGLSKKKLQTQGFGPHRPIDPADDLEAYALNRRVEIWLDGVSDPESIVRDLNALK